MLQANGQVARRNTNPVAGAAAAPPVPMKAKGFWTVFVGTLMRALAGVAV